VLPALLLACGPTPIALRDSAAPPAPDSPPTDTGAAVEQAGEVVVPEEPPLYVEGEILDVSLTLGEDARRVLYRGDRAWVDATLGLGDETWAVSIKLKGSSTFDTLSGKPSLKVDADRVVPDQKIRGETKFDLHNQVIDPSMMSETMTYATYRAAGLPAPRTTYARLTIDGEPYGLYNIVEPPTRAFLRDWFGEDDRNLYENGWQDCDVTDPSCFDVEQDDEGNHDALATLAEVAALSGEEWEQRLPEVLDVDAFAAAMAMETMVAHWDGYAYDLSNYRLYHTSGGFVFLPWSADLDYGFRPWSYPDCGMYGVALDDYDDGILALRCEESAWCHALVVEKMAAFVEAWDTTQQDELYALIRDDVYADERKRYSSREFEEHVTCVRDWLEQRPDEVRAWVASQ
jgi:hypothetical protein